MDDMALHDLTLPFSRELMRKGSPVICINKDVRAKATGVVGYMGTPNVWVLWRNGITSARLEPMDPNDIALDLTDPTGRVHASWHVTPMDWSPLIHEPSDHKEGATGELNELTFDAVCSGMPDMDEWWTEKRIRRFRDLCLKLLEKTDG